MDDNERYAAMKISIDDLDLGESIGLGTVGEIYRGQLKTGGEPVAVKFLQKNISQEELVRARFIREMSILERLNHPNIIHYYGGGEHNGQLFYAMEEVDGGNVKDLLDRYEKLSWKETASIARQVCSALQHAHNFGIIHRDLKPSNLFLTTDAQVKLADFGIARDTHSADITQQGLTVGTHSYMPPEQIRGEDEVTGKADLYSLGCVLFELLTGEKPFAGDNFAQLFEQHLFQPAPKISDRIAGCPVELESIIAQLLEKAPDDRPFNARAVQGTMIKLLEDEVGAAEAATSGDVGAGTVTDAGTLLLRNKLTVGLDRHVRWGALAVIGVVAILLLAILAIKGATSIQ